MTSSMMPVHGYREKNLSKQEFSATPRTFLSNSLILHHFQVQLWLEAISYQDRFEVGGSHVLLLYSTVFYDLDPRSRFQPLYNYICPIDINKSTLVSVLPQMESNIIPTFLLNESLDCYRFYKASRKSKIMLNCFVVF